MVGLEVNSLGWKGLSMMGYWVSNLGCLSAGWRRWRAGEGVGRTPAALGGEETVHEVDQVRKTGFLSTEIYNNKLIQSKYLNEQVKISSSSGQEH